MNDFKIPVNNEITILPADEVKKDKLGFFVKEYLGSKIYLKNSDGYVFDMVPITDENGIKEGDQILVPSLVGGYHIMTVQKGLKYASNGYTNCLLEYGIDDRKCWICTGMYNLRGITK